MALSVDEKLIEGGAHPPGLVDAVPIRLPTQVQESATADNRSFAGLTFDHEGGTLGA